MANKYDVQIDPQDQSTSHGLVIELVGEGKRVLDAGCATGYLAKILRDRGNEVSGVEVDRDAAEQAKPYLSRLVIGDLEELDLVDEFGPGSFDVVVFADVLEHLRDPVRVLAQCIPLLADGGSIVVSIPNVAHGAVRLALLQGRFEYRNLGLLDDTHLRFFTRSSFQALMRDAGLVALDMRRTVAGPFQTEIPLDPSAYPPELIDHFASDPDWTTYQFVARAVPAVSREAAGAILRELADRDFELATLREQSRTLATALGDGTERPVVGVLDGAATADTITSVRMAVALGELRRRLPGYDIRPYALVHEPVAVGFGDEQAWPLKPWNSDRVTALRSQIDCLVVVPGPAPPDRETRRVLEDLVSLGLFATMMPGTFPGELCHWMQVEEEVPDPPPARDGEILTLLSRSAPPVVLASRAEYLRITERLPEGEYAVAVSGDATGISERSAQRLDQQGLRQLVQLGLRNKDATSHDTSTGNGAWLPESVLDLPATLASASLVITNRPDIAALAGALGRPVVPEGDLVPEGLEAPEGVLDVALDQLCDKLTTITAPRFTRALVHRVGDLLEQLQMLKAVNAGLQANLIRERTALATRLEREGNEAASSMGVESAPRKELQERLATAEARATHLEEEIQHIYATKTMRALQPARKFYSRVRSLGR